MIILGIDTSLRSSGSGVLSVEGSRMRALEAGRIKNAGTMLVLGEARGAVIVAAAEANVPVYEYEPRRVKMAVCGNGLAEKIQIQRMVKTLLALDELPQNDAADALALAITHAHSNSVLNARTPI